MNASQNLILIFLDKNTRFGYIWSMKNKISFRGVHRALAYAFTVLVLANVVSAFVGGPEWIGYLALAPLLLMMFTGWYLLWLPHSRKGHKSSRAR